MCFLGIEQKIFATERNNSGLSGTARKFRQTIRLKAAAGQDVSAANRLLESYTNNYGNLLPNWFLCFTSLLDVICTPFLLLVMDLTLLSSATLKSFTSKFKWISPPKALKSLP